MRRERRFSFRYMNRIRVYNHLSGDFMGVVGDLSASGMRLFTRQPLAMGAAYEMRLDYPVPYSETQKIYVTMQCRWIRKDPDGGGFQVGCVLDQPSEEFSELVSLTMARHRRNSLLAR